MGQKINPIALRIETTNRYSDHIWFSEYYYTKIFQQNLMVQNYINSILTQINYSSDRLYIQNYSKNLRMNFFLCHSVKLRHLKAKSFQLQLLKKKYKSNYLFNQLQYFKKISVLDEKQSLKGIQNFMFFKNLESLPSFIKSLFYKFLFKNFYFMDLKNLRKQFYLRFFILSFHFFKVYDESYKKIIIFHKIQRLNTYDLSRNLLQISIEYLRLSFLLYNKKIKTIFLKKKYNIKTLQKFSMNKYNLSISLFFYAAKNLHTVALSMQGSSYRIHNIKGNTRSPQYEGLNTTYKTNPAYYRESQKNNLLLFFYPIRDQISVFTEALIRKSHINYIEALRRSPFIKSTSSKASMQGFIQKHNGSEETLQTEMKGFFEELRRTSQTRGYLKDFFIKMKLSIKKIYSYKYMEIFLKKNKFFLYDKFYNIFLYKKNTYNKRFLDYVNTQNLSGSPKNAGLKSFSNSPLHTDSKRSEARKSVTFFFKKRWLSSVLFSTKYILGKRHKSYKNYNFPLSSSGYVANKSIVTIGKKDPTTIKLFKYIQKFSGFTLRIKNINYHLKKNDKNFRFYNSTIKKPFIFPVTLQEDKQLTMAEKILPNLFFLNHIEFILSRKIKSYTQLVFYKTLYDYQSASFLAQEIIYFLEKKVPFRKIKNKYLKDLYSNPIIRGFRITCSGRVGGKSKKAQRAKIESVKYGQTSLHIFSSKIDFSAKTALTPFGSIGIKVWICYF